MATLEELATEEAAPKTGNNLEDLAAAEAAPAAQSAPLAKPEPSFWQKAKDALTPDDSTVPSTLMAAQNGVSGGLAPKITAGGEMALRTVGHGLAPESVDDPSWKDILAKHQSLFGQSSAMHPAADVAGSMLIPVPGGGGLAARALKMGGASALQSATRAYGESPDMDPAAVVAKKAPEIGVSGGLGALLGAGGYAASKLAGRGEQMASNAVAKNAQQVANEAEAARRSAGRAVGVESTAAHTVLANAREAAGNPNLSLEEAQRAKDFLASEYAKNIAGKANALNLERGGSMGSAMDRAAKARDAVAEKYSPEGTAAIEAERLDRPEMRGGLWEIAKRVAPTVGGYALDKALGGSGEVGGGLGLVAGAIGGQPGRIIRNRFAKPAFQKALGDVTSLGASTAEGAMQSPAAVRAASGVGSLAEYLDLLKEQDQ